MKNPILTQDEYKKLLERQAIGSTINKGDKDRLDNCLKIFGIYVV